MRPIDADRIITIQLYDDDFGQFGEMTMTIAEALDRFTKEKCPPGLDINTLKKE